MKLLLFFNGNGINRKNSHNSLCMYNLVNYDNDILINTYSGFNDQILCSKEEALLGTPDVPTFCFAARKGCVTI